VFGALVIALWHTATLRAPRHDRLNGRCRAWRLP
jgi:hypothetical protein